MSTDVTKSTSQTSQPASGTNQEIIHDDFYVIADEAETEAELREFESASNMATQGKVQIMVPGEFSKDNLTEGEKPADADEQEYEETILKKPQENAEEELGADFFEKVDDDDAEKKQVVEEIAGMSDSTETDVRVEKSEVDAAEPKELNDSLPVKTSSIQFKEQEKEDTEVVIVKSVPSKKSMGRASFIGKRASTHVPKSSLMTVSAEGSTIMKRKSRQGSVFGESRFSFSKRDGNDFSVPDYFGKPAARMYEGRGTFYAEFGPRYRQTDDDELDFDIGGDGAPIFFEVASEEEEESIIQEEEEPTKLERKPFYDRHDKAAQEITVRKIRNFILHKKLAMYFKRKKMDYVIKETDWSFDTQSKYFKKLEAYGDLMDFVVFDKDRVSKELEETKTIRVDKYNKLTTMFKKMQDREGEIGYGLISSKTGNALPDKFVERLIRRQNTQLTQVSSMRLTFIRLKGMVQEKLDSIATLNEIAPGFLLVDYEQLKSDNRAYADKIEEKDEELTRLRIKCGSTIQVLAHLREKTSALENDLGDLIETRTKLEESYFDVRSRLNEQKQARDTVRHALNKMRDESGLLTQPTLLKDMEQGLTDIKNLTNQLKQIMKEHKRKSKQITTIRKKIEITVDLRRGFSRRDLTIAQSSTRYLKKDKFAKLYKGRPSLMLPVVEDSAFTNLKSIKPKLTYDRSQRNRINIIKQNKRTGG